MTHEVFNRAFVKAMGGAKLTEEEKAALYAGMAEGDTRAVRCRTGAPRVECPDNECVGDPEPED